MARAFEELERELEEEFQDHFDRVVHAAVVSGATAAPTLRVPYRKNSTRSSAPPTLGSGRATRP